MLVSPAPLWAPVTTSSPSFDPTVLLCRAEEFEVGTTFSVTVLDPSGILGLAGYPKKQVLCTQEVRGTSYVTLSSKTSTPPLAQLPPSPPSLELELQAIPEPTPGSGTQACHCPTVPGTHVKNVRQQAGGLSLQWGLRLCGEEAGHAAAQERQWDAGDAGRRLGGWLEWEQGCDIPPVPMTSPRGRNERERIANETQGS